jgi:hypothetical protein
MVLIIIVCAIAWGVCRFKKVDFVDTLFIGFLIGIASIYISGFIGLCTALLTQTETYKNVNYYVSHGKLSAYSKENIYITAATEDDSYTDFSIVKKQDMAEGENILVKETYQGALKNYSCLFLGKQLNILFMRKENNYASNAYMYDSRSYVF